MFDQLFYIHENFERENMHYTISSEERWTMCEHCTYEKDGEQITVTYKFKFGSVEVHSETEISNDGPFSTATLDDWFILDTGDEEFVEITSSNVNVKSIMQLIEEANPDDVREFLEEELGWEYIENQVVMTSYSIDEHSA